jgi:hypothetical protein
MRMSLILGSAAIMAVIVPATLFAQTAPVQQAVSGPAATYTVAKTIPATAPAPEAPASVKPVVVPTAAAVAPVKHTAVKTTVAKSTTVKKPAIKTAAVKTTAKVTAVKAAAKVASAGAGASDLDTARAVLASLKAKYRYLDGVTVTVGNTPGGYQAVSYYTKGAIVLSPSHTASVERIMKHEIWHIIDWRDNGKIDWRESVPPHNAADYLK